jgi:nitrogen regulatory protein PII
MYQSIVVIVDKGRGEVAVEAAREAGSAGATIINARGAGIHETSRLFSMEIEPEKELVLMIIKESQTEHVIASLSAHLDIEKAGNGIIFVQNVNQTYGLYE